MFPGETIRFFLSASHYRRPIDFSNERIEEVRTGLDGFYRFFHAMSESPARTFINRNSRLAAQQPRSPAESGLVKSAAEHRQRFLEFMDDDFNTGGAIGDLFEFARTLNRFVDTEDSKTRPIGSQARLTS